jgi:arylsulfatase A-like enzyme
VQPLLGRSKRRPRFIVLHANIAHDYYTPKSDPYLSPEVRSGPPAYLGDRVITWRDTDAGERAEVVSIYDACMRQLTRKVGVVLDAVRQRDDFVTAIAADHGEGFEPDVARRPGRCANRIVLLVAATNGNTEDRVDGLSAVHPDFVDEGLEQGLDRGGVTAGQRLGHPVTERRQFRRR